MLLSVSDADVDGLGADHGIDVSVPVSGGIDDLFMWVLVLLSVVSVLLMLMLVQFLLVVFVFLMLLLMELISVLMVLAF